MERTAGPRSDMKVESGWKRRFPAWPGPSKRRTLYPLSRAALPTDRNISSAVPSKPLWAIRVFRRSPAFPWVMK